MYDSSFMDSAKDGRRRERQCDFFLAASACGARLICVPREVLFEFFERVLWGF